MVAKDVRERQKFNSLSDVEKVEHVRNRLQHNLEVLKGLEEEFMKEAITRDDLNKELEDQGHLTLPEKIEALKKKFAELSGANIDEMETNIEEFVKTQQDNLDSKSTDATVDELDDEELASVENDESIVSSIPEQSVEEVRSSEKVDE